MVGEWWRSWASGACGGWVGGAASAVLSLGLIMVGYRVGGFCGDGAWWLGGAHVGSGAFLLSFFLSNVVGGGSFGRSGCVCGEIGWVCAADSWIFMLYIRLNIKRKRVRSFSVGLFNRFLGGFMHSASIL